MWQGKEHAGRWGECSYSHTKEILSRGFLAVADKWVTVLIHHSGYFSCDQECGDMN